MVSPPQRQTSAIRACYLDDIIRDAEARLHACTRHARLLDLGVRHDPAAVQPWGHHDPEHRQQFDGIVEAFRASDYRLALIAGAGCGKTTTLWRLVRDWAHEARQHDDLPIPFVCGLSSFHIRRGTPVETWLLGEMAACPGVDLETAQLWLRERQVALFIDGLDELPDAERADVVRLLNTTFLRTYSHVPMLICGREDEYRRLEGAAETRLSLRSCVRLEPLTDAQIASYLAAAGATSLMDALREDVALRELAGTPLTLSMLVHVATANDLRRLTAGSPAERRHALHEMYVACMLQRQARRERGKIFDGVSRNDVPVHEYRYSPEQINAWLGWLAETLSARMEGEFSPARFARLLPADVQPRREPFVFLATWIARAMLLGASLLGVAVPIVPHTISAWKTAGAIIGLACLLLPAIAAGWRSENKLLSGALRCSMWVVTVPLACCLTAYAVCAVAGVSPRAAPLVSIVVAAAGSVAAIISRLDGSAAQFRLLVGLLAVPLAGWGIRASGASGFIADQWIQGALLAVGFPLAIRFALELSVRFGDIVIACVLALGFGAIAGFSGWVGAESWVCSLIALAATATLTLLLWSRTGVTHLVIGAAFVCAMGLITTPASAIVCLFASVFVGLVVCALGHWRIEFEMERAGAIIQDILLNPFICMMLAITRRFPARKRRFIACCVEAALLREVRGDVGFAHQSVRDHFALRRIVPRTAPHGHDRFAAIRSLGYHGDASLGLLLNLSRDEDPRVRAAAVEGLSHLASSAALPVLADRLTDSDAEVRRALVAALWLIGPEGAGITNRLSPLADGAEIDGLFVYRPGVASEYWGNFERLVEVIGAAAVNPLARYLRASHPWQRIRAARFLGVLHRPEAEALLIDRLRQDERADVRMMIVLALKNSSTQEARKAVGRSRRDKSDLVRHVALAPGVWDPLD